MTSTAAVNTAALMHAWPSVKNGRLSTSGKPVRGARAELSSAGAHTAWTATRVLGGAATLGVSAALFGRKSKGAASLGILLADGTVESYPVRPKDLQAANRYVIAFNNHTSSLSCEEDVGEAGDTGGGDLPRGESVEIEEGDYLVWIKHVSGGFVYRILRTGSRRPAGLGASGAGETLDQVMDAASAKIEKYAEKDARKAS